MSCLDWKDQNRAVVSAENHDYCDYYVRLDFKDLMGYDQRGNNVQTIGRGRKDLVTLVKNGATLGSTAYTTRSYRGNINKKVNPDFVYALPVQSGDSIRFRVHRKERFTSLFSFKYATSDTVYACRAGRVCDNRLTDTSTKTLYRMERIFIYHNDGSIGEYFQFSKPLVYPGDDVKMGQPIAILESHEKGRTAVAFSVYFLDKNMIDSGSGQVHSSIVPIFHSANHGDVKLEEKTTYISEGVTEEMLLQDMSKKEREKYMKNKEKQNKK